MEQLNEKAMSFIARTVNTAATLDIDEVLITKDLVTGIDEDKSVFIFDQSAPATLGYDLPDVALTRVGKLRSRLELLRKQSECVGEYQLKLDLEYIQRIKFKANKSKLAVDYTCGRPMMIKAMKRVHDTSVIAIKIDPADFAIINQAKDAISTETIRFTITPDKVTITLTDDSNDKLVHELSTLPECIDDNFDFESLHFSREYPLKKLLRLIKGPDTIIMFGKGEDSKGGIAFMYLNDLMIGLLPQAL